jgi:hypothetical protein
MNMSEDDGLEELGWLVAAMAALAFLFFAVVYLLNWMGVMV